jgi:choline dehydrogenase
LEEAGIEAQHHLPGVGANLQDHLEIYFQVREGERVREKSVI